MRRAIWILAAVVVAAALVIGLVQAGGESTAETPPRPQSLERMLERLEGAPPELAKLHRDANTIRAADLEDYERTIAELRGRPVVVNAWAAWCGPCKLEFPFFQEAATRLGGEIAFLGLNVNDDREAAERFLEKTPVPYPHLEDGDSRILQQVARAAGLPATIFYDADGEQTFVHQGGYRSEQDLVEDIERYTAGA